MKPDVVSSKEGIQVRIDSASGLLSGLRHPDRVRRASLLRAIRHEPIKALSFGPIDGRDVVDELLSLCEETKGTADRWDYFFTALSLVDERTAEFAKREFLVTHDPRCLVSAARRISQLPEAEKVGFLSPVILESREVNRCRLCANLLAGSSRLATRVALRVAAISDRPSALPPLDAETVDAWITELQGPYPQKVRKLLLQTSEGALDALLSFWAKLPEQVRIWALCLGVEEKVDGCASLIWETVKQERGGALLRTALMCVQKCAPEHQNEALLLPLYRHEDPAIRAAAIAAGWADIDCSSLLRDETSQDVRLAIVTRLGRCGGSEADTNLLVSLLNDHSWRVRALAVDLLVNMAPASLPALRGTLSSASEEAKVAAVQALFRLGKEDWIKEALL